MYNFVQYISKENDFNKELIISHYYYNSNNDAFNFLLLFFLHLKKFFVSIYDNFSLFILRIKNFIYKVNFILILIIILFSYSTSYIDDSSISTSFIINAYFPKNNITIITHEMIVNKEKKESGKLLLNSKNIKDNMSYKINTNIFEPKAGIIYNKDKKGNDEKDFFCNNIEGNKSIKSYNKFNEDEIYNHIKDLEDIINNKMKRYNQMNNNLYKSNDEYFLFNCISIKIIIINFICFLFLFFFIKFTIKKKKSFCLLYIVCQLVSYKFICILYYNGYYLASNFIFILFIYSNKMLIDSIYLKLNFKRKDFEIFTTNLIANNIKQFNLKIIILINKTLLSGILSIFFFKSWLNYIIYFLCLLNLIGFLGNCFEQVATHNLKPIKNIIFFFVGAFNLLLSKTVKYSLFDEQTINQNINNAYNDSLYLVNDFFSLYYLEYINGYIDFQYENKNIIIIKNNYIWLSLFLFSIFIGYFGIYSNEFIFIIISIYMTNKIMNNFCKLYHYRLCRFLNSIIIINYLIIIQEIPQIKDYYLINLLLSLTNSNEQVSYFFFKFIILLALLYYIINTNYYFYIKYNSLETKVVKNNNHKDKISCLVYTILEIIFQFLIICLIIVIFDYYENNLMMKGLYLFLVLIVHLLKIANIKEIKENNHKCYNFIILFMIITSLRLIILSGTKITIFYLINHINLILIIHGYILNDKTINILFQFVVIFLLLFSYYLLNSNIFIIDIIDINIFQILIIISNDRTVKSENKKVEKNIKYHNKVIASYFLSLIAIFLIKMIYSNDCYQELIEDVKNLLNIEQCKKNIGERFELNIISNLLYIIYK